MLNTPDNGEPARGTTARPLLALLLFGMAIKVFLFCTLILPRSEAWSERILSDAPLDYDDREYFLTARSLARTGELLDPSAPANAPIRQVYRTPGYPAILALIGTVAGWAPARTLLLQALLLSLVPPLFASILRRLRWSTVPAWLLAVDPLSNLLSLSFMTEMWLVLCLLLALRLWIESDKHLVCRGGALLLFVIATLIKPSVQYFLVVVLALTFVHYSGRRKTAVLAVLACLPLLGWAYRNHGVAGRFCISTQTDACVMAPITIDALERGVPIVTVVGEWDERLGRPVMRVIMDNKLDFVDETKAYLRSHPFLFVKYHLLGIPRLLLGAGREHLAQTVYHGRRPPSMPLYSGFMVAYYLLVYAGVLAGFSRGWLRDPTCRLAILFIAYNIAIMGIYTYSTGGGLKRLPFLPFVYLLLACGSRTLTRRTAALLRRVSPSSA